MKIAILPGDGIGTEIVAEALKVLERLRRDGVPVETETAPIGGAGYDAAKQPLPDATLRLAQSADAVLMGAVGGPQYDALPRASRPEQGLLAIRKALGLFANLRPALLYPELAAASSLKPEGRPSWRPLPAEMKERLLMVRLSPRATWSRSPVRAKPG